MHDTTEDIGQRIILMMNDRTPTERLKMVSDMFHSGKMLALAGIQAQQHDLTAPQLRLELIRRLYGADFSPEEMARICAHFAGLTLRNDAGGATYAL